MATMTANKKIKTISGPAQVQQMILLLRHKVLLPAKVGFTNLKRFGFKNVRLDGKAALADREATRRDLMRERVRD